MQQKPSQKDPSLAQRISASLRQFPMAFADGVLIASIYGVAKDVFTRRQHNKHHPEALKTAADTRQSMFATIGKWTLILSGVFAVIETAWAFRKGRTYIDKNIAELEKELENVGIPSTADLTATRQPEAEKLTAPEAPSKRSHAAAEETRRAEASEKALSPAA